MSSMADPIDALHGLQEAINAGTPLNLRELDADYQTRCDESDFGKRYIFSKIIDGEVQALAIFGLESPIGGEECYNVGYAVSENHRRRGLAFEAVSKGIDELEKIFSRTAKKSFYLEAVIDVTNSPSIKFAEKLFSGSGALTMERESGLPALHFKKLIVIQ